MWEERQYPLESASLFIYEAKTLTSPTLVQTAQKGDF